MTANTKMFLRSKGLAPNKKLGQNFLVREATARRIVDLAGLQPQDQVLEIGVGLGALTMHLAAAAAEVIGLETDSGIIRLHQEQQDLPANVRLLHADALKVDLQSLTPTTGGLKIVANLPYSISTPFLFRLIEHSHLIDFAVLMLQKEVAQRLMAQAHSKEYGIPTVLLATCAEVRSLLAVDPTAFHPQPMVDSLVIRLDFNPLSARLQGLGNFDRKLLSRVVHAAFSSRRKTLLNALYSGHFTRDKARLARYIENAGILPSVRAEALQPEDFITLSRVLDRAANHIPDNDPSGISGDAVH